MSALERWILQYMIVIIGVVAAGGAQADPVASFSTAVAQIRPSVVAIGTIQRTRSPQYVYLGTGFSAGDGTLIATNAHVLPDSLNDQALETLVIIQQQGSEKTVRTVSKLTSDPAHDVAILKIITGAPVPPVQLGNPDKVKEGQEVAFSGFPMSNILGLYPVSHHGYISAIAPIAIPAANTRLLDPHLVRMLSAGPYDIFQLDITSYPGNSGGPVFEMDGSVIGIVNSAAVKEGRESAFSQPTGISYAIPIRHLQALLKTLNK